MEKVNFLRYRWDKIPECAIKECAGLYCQVWQEPPWNEHSWKANEVLADMRRELEKPGAEGFIAFYRPAIVAGFTWGYPVSPKELRDIAGNEKLDFLFNNGENRVFYIDELGVASEYRRRGIGKKLSSLLIVAAKSQNLSVAILRTDEKAVAARNLYADIGFKELTARDERYPERTYWTMKL